MQCMMSRMQPFPNNTDIIIINNQQHHENQSSSSSSSSNISNLSPSILTISLILIITLFATVSLILFLRRRSSCLPICNNPTLPPPSPSSSHRHVSPLLLIDSLPLLSFSSVSSLAGECAVCLSKFQPHDQLRLLPLCLHAFHARCVDSWLRLNLTCPLCRSTVIVSDGSFRLEIGSVSQRGSDSAVSAASSGRRRSYSMGSLDSGDGSGKSAVDLPSTPAEARLAADVAEERSWLRECMDRVAETVSSRSLSFRSSGRFFTGSSRRSNVGDGGELNLEAGSIGDEIGELFRWASGV